MNPLKLPITSVIDGLGRSTILSSRYIWKLALFTLDNMMFWRGHSIGRGLTRRAVNSQIIFSGIDALPIISIIALALGLSLCAQLILLLQSVTTDADLIRILNQTLVLELAPLLTAFILTGRSGSAIAVDLGNMSQRGELLGLEYLGMDTRRHFAFPRMLGLLFSQLCLAVYFSLIVMVVGVVFSAFLSTPSNYKYLFILADAITPYDLMLFVLKNSLFGLLIGSIACFHGLRVGNSVTEVPQQTQIAIVNSLILIFVVDGLLVLAR
jgi:phospholipid/cholesterol/gamma-HCH transport system permease protein